MPRKGRILIVDDTQANLAAFEALLSPLGHAIDLSNSAYEGITYALTNNYDVILLDVRMPIMNGPEIADRLRKEERTRSTPILFISAFEGLPAMVAESPTSGPVDFLFNLDPELLRAKVSGWVQLRLEADAERQRADDLAREVKRLQRQLEG